MQANPKLSTTPPLPGVVAVPALNDALQTIATDFSGDTDPAALAWPFSKWADTSTGLLKRRNAAGTEWVVEGSLFRRALNIIPSDEIPSSDIGLIATPSQGLMEWDGTRYAVTHGAHGQCLFVRVSAAECRLIPHNGDGLVINGRQYHIPPGGVPLTTAGLAANTGYYVAAVENGLGGFALEARPATSNPRSTHTDGVEILSGDPSRTLVGWVGTGPAIQFLDSATERRVASWFNKRRRPMGAAVGSATASNVNVALSTVTSAFAWAGTMTDAIVGGYGTNPTAPGAYGALHLRRDGVVFTSECASSFPNAVFNSLGSGENTLDGLHTYQLWGLVSGGTMNMAFNYVTTSEI